MVQPVFSKSSPHSQHVRCLASIGNRVVSLHIVFTSRGCLQLNLGKQATQRIHWDKYPSPEMHRTNVARFYLSPNGPRT
jgi:hypothetical protein